MSAAYWYFDGAPGVRFCFAKEPAFICPNSRSLWDYTELSTGETTVVERRPGERMGVTFSRHITDQHRLAAEALGMDPELLVGMILRSHSTGSGRRRVNGKLTDECKSCGAKMERLGFRCWTEQDKPPEDYGTSDRMTVAFGGSPSHIAKVHYLDTKKEARAWALENAQLSQSIAKEGATDGK